MRTVTELAPVSPAGTSGGRDWVDLLFGRTLPALFFGLFIVYELLVTGIAATRLSQPGAGVDDYLAFANRVLRLTFFTMLVVLYVVRLQSKKADRRPFVVLVSMVGTFCVLLTSYLPAVPHGPGFLLAGDLLLTIGMAWAVWGLAYLRRSFSILPEARRLVTGGPFGLCRNPLYLGEGVATIGVVLPGFSPWHLLLLAVFVSSQLLRIRWEQRVLLDAFGDEYRSYLGRVPMLIPFWPVRP
ncbi:MAG TPA: isoprenylcysteine carboxylmethyltransferase family protein [Candidatus Dormibacteraeota bacterium]|nr:isoprenylcysteine carboxylmethyltransferase family protein [Candidatus Dormibacteraeota bacterium]